MSRTLKSFQLSFHFFPLALHSTVIKVPALRIKFYQDSRYLEMLLRLLISRSKYQCFNLHLLGTSPVTTSRSSAANYLRETPSKCCLLSQQALSPSKLSNPRTTYHCFLEFHQCQGTILFPSLQSESPTTIHFFFAAFFTSK